jgi:hypothetical protein
MNTKKFRKQEFEFTPQLDVDEPKVRLEEGTCNIDSYGAVYDLTLIDQHDWEDKKQTTLTLEELVVLRNYINHLLETREKDPNRQGQNV